MSLYRFALIFPLRILIIFVTCLYYSLGRCRWYPLSLHWLRSLDKKAKSLLKHKHSSDFVTVNVNGKNVKIWTVSVKTDKPESTIPIILIHGITGGCNLFLNNIDEFAKHRDVYLIDLPGWGFSGAASIRVKYENGWWVQTTAEDVEMFYVQSLEMWFKKMNLEKAILLGHGLGSYVCSVYSMFCPHRVAHLILTEPWGFNRRPLSADNRPFMTNKPLMLFSELYAQVFIFTPIRALGPFALPLYRIFRLGMKEKFMAYLKGLDPQTTSIDRVKQLMMEERTEYFPDMTMQDYTYLWMMHSRNGEIAFDRLSIPFGWPRLPLEERLEDLSDDVDITFIFGSKSWVRKTCGWQAKHHRHDSHVEVHEIAGAGHHVYADRPSAFNSIVTLIGEAVDKGVKPNIIKNFKQRSKDMSRLRRQVSSSMMLQAAEASLARPPVGNNNRSDDEFLELGEGQEARGLQGEIPVMDEPDEEGSGLDEMFLGAVGSVEEEEHDSLMKYKEESGFGDDEVLLGAVGGVGEGENESLVEGGCWDTLWAGDA